MAGTPNSTGGIDPLLDREDPRAMAVSAEQQWSSVSYLLGLPQNVNALPGTARLVATNIANRIAAVRGAGVLPGLIFQLEQQHNLELQASAALLNGLPGAPPTNPNVALADAWLKVIYRNVTEQDLRFMLANIRGTAIEVNGAAVGLWPSVAIRSGGNVAINLNHPAWRTGDERTIRARLLSRVPADVGVEFTGVAHLVLTEAVINEIFATTNNIRLSPNDPRAIQASTLADAIARRAPIEQLFAGTADARELMLAMATVQRDPTTVLAIATPRSNAQNDLLENERLFVAASAAKNLQSLPLPKFTAAQVVDGESAMQKIIENATHGMSANDGDTVNLFAGTITPRSGAATTVGTALTMPEVALANTLGIKSSLSRKIVAATFHTSGAVTSAAQDNVESFNKVMESAQKATEKFAEATAAIQAIESTIQTLATELRERALVPDATLYPLLHRYIDLVGTPPSYDRIPNVVDSSFNATAFLAEYRRALLTVNPARAVSLGTPESYEAKRQELGQKVIDAQSAPAGGPNGSDACWKVIRRGLEHQGLAGKQLEDTVGYMRSRMQGTPESLRDLETLADAVYSVGPNAAENLREDNELRDAWNKRNSIASARRLGMAKYDYASEYRDNLFSARNIGMTLQENPLATRRPLAELTHAYFRTKHFLALPEDDPNHLPGTSDVIAFMRRLHAAILRRTQESLHRAEIQQLKALGMNIDAEAVATMTLSQRVQAIHDFLRGGSSSYESHFKTQLDTMAKRASRARTEARQRREKWRGNLLGSPKSAVGYLNPLTWVRAAGSAAVSETAVKTGKAIVKSVPALGGGAGIGATVGTFMIPIPLVGTAIGAGVGALCGAGYKFYKYLTK